MTKSQFEQFLLKEIFPKLQSVREDGQKEYAHDSKNAFANFERLADDLGLSREKVLWVYLRKHLDGILAHVNGHTSQREPVEGRIKDAIMYLCLLWGMEDENVKMALTEIDEIINGDRELKFGPSEGDRFIGKTVQQIVEEERAPVHQFKPHRGFSYCTVCGGSKENSIHNT